MDTLRAQVWSRRAKYKEDTDAFLAIHGKQHEHRGYNYIVTHYQSLDEPLVIICPTHSLFVVLPSDFVMGRGCPVCDGTVKLVDHLKDIAILPCPPPLSPYPDEPINDGLEYLKLTTSTFSRQALRLHKGLYTYERTQYVHKATPVIISCPEHGDFRLSPYYHLKGSICPACRRANGR